MARYIVTDPCYVLTDDQLTEGDYYTYDTAFGDGYYYDQSNNRYAVDSGRLACIEVDAVTEVERLNDMLALGIAHTFDYDDLLADDCNYVEGVITFGPVVIDTN